MTIHYNQAAFLQSVAKLSQLPPDEGREVAVAGRSNAGKSSAINVLTQQKSLARTSKTPGRTQLLNFFILNRQCRLVDLPGYGYAKVSHAMKKHWQALIEQYLLQRQCLSGIVLVMDIRHPLKQFDQDMITWSQASQLPLHILLTKADKLKRGAAQQTLLAIHKQLDSYPNVSIQLFSALKQQGIEEAHQKLDEWLLGEGTDTR